MWMPSLSTLCTWDAMAFRCESIKSGQAPHRLAPAFSGFLKIPGQRHLRLDLHIAYIAAPAARPPSSARFYVFSFHKLPPEQLSGIIVSHLQTKDKLTNSGYNVRICRKEMSACTHVADDYLPVVYQFGAARFAVRAAWPVMRLQFGRPCLGGVTMIIAGGTICSSLLSERLTRRFSARGDHSQRDDDGRGAGRLSTASAFWMLCVWAIPYGLGAGAVDAALSNMWRCTTAPVT